MLPFRILLVFPDGSVKTDKREGARMGHIVKVMTRVIKTKLVKLNSRKSW